MKIGMLVPSHDRVLVRLDAAQQETVGNGILLATSDVRHCFGEVVAVGTGTIVDGILREPSHKLGQRVLLLKNSGIAISQGSEQYLLVRDSEILAVEETE